MHGRHIAGLVRTVYGDYRLNVSLTARLAAWSRASRVIHAGSTLGGRGGVDFLRSGLCLHTRSEPVNIHRSLTHPCRAAELIPCFYANSLTSLSTYLADRLISPFYAIDFKRLSLINYMININFILLS